MKGGQEGCSAKATGSRRKRIAAVCVVLVLAAGVAGFCLTEEKEQEAQRTGSIEAARIEIPGCETQVLNPLRREENSDIERAVKEYYQGLKEKSDFVEAYEDIQVFAKNGKYKDTYVAFARYGMKIKDIYTKVPGLGTLYVRKDSEQGGFRVVTEELDDDTKEQIQTVAGHEDVKSLLAEIEKEYKEAVQSDALLREALADLKNAYESSAGQE